MSMIDWEDRSSDTREALVRHLRATGEPPVECLPGRPRTLALFTAFVLMVPPAAAGVGASHEVLRGAVRSGCNYVACQARSSMRDVPSGLGRSSPVLLKNLRVVG